MVVHRPTPNPARNRVPALDGLRGLAVAAVVAYHLSPDALPGGYLGVSVFFVLSGFLITSLLRAEAEATDRIALEAFWGRRFRRLMPAALAGLALALAVAALAGDPSQLRSLPADVVAALAYVANWHFIAQGTAYGAHYLQPSLIQHYWSLAIEEQFYLVVAVLAAALARWAPSRRAWAVAFGALALGSMLVTVALGAGHADRIYFGTDTRAFELLAGALLALVMTPRGARPGQSVPTSAAAVASAAAVTGTGTGTPQAARPWWRRSIGTGTAVALVGAAGLLAACRWLALDDLGRHPAWLWAIAAATVAMVIGACRPGPVARVLSWRPLVALGLVSYGVYVYHWPLLIWLTPDRTGLDGVALAALRIAATLAVSLASYRWLEQPIRQRRWRLRPTLALGLVGVTAALLIAGTGGLRSRADARAVVALPDIAVAVPTTAGGNPAPAATPPPGRVLMIGDSMLHDAFPAMQTDLGRLGIEARAIGGPSQTLMGNGARWLGELSQAVEADNPDVVVLDSCCGDRNPWTRPDGQTVQAETPEYWSEWRRLAADITARAQARGARALWVLPPPADGDRSRWYGAIDQRMQAVRAIYRDIAATTSGVGLIDWGVLARPDGSYTATLEDRAGHPVVVRAADGVHFSPAGQALQAQTTVEQLLAEWGRLGGRRA